MAYYKKSAKRYSRGRRSRRSGARSLASKAKTFNKLKFAAKRFKRRKFKRFVRKNVRKNSRRPLRYPVITHRSIMKEQDIYLYNSVGADYASIAFFAEPGSAANDTAERYDHVSMLGSFGSRTIYDPTSYDPMLYRKFALYNEYKIAKQVIKYTPNRGVYGYAVDNVEESEYWRTEDFNGKIYTLDLTKLPPIQGSGTNMDPSFMRLSAEDLEAWLINHPSVKVHDMRKPFTIISRPCALASGDYDQEWVANDGTHQQVLVNKWSRNWKPITVRPATNSDYRYSQYVWGGVYIFARMPRVMEQVSALTSAAQVPAESYYLNIGIIQVKFYFALRGVQTNTTDVLSNPDSEAFQAMASRRLATSRALADPSPNLPAPKLQQYQSESQVVDSDEDSQGEDLGSEDSDTEEEEEDLEEDLPPPTLKSSLLSSSKAVPLRRQNAIYEGASVRRVGERKL